MNIQDIYSKESAEALLGTEEYRAEVYDDSPAYEVDIYDIGKYGGKWYEIRGQGCSCWGGEYSVDVDAGFDTLDELRKEITAEYGSTGTGYYAPLLEAWDVAFAAVPQELR